MKVLLLFSLACVFVLSASGQTIGVKCNAGFSSLEQSDYEAGAGVFVGINDFSKKVEILFSMDFNKSNTFIEDDKESSYTRNYFSAAGLYVFRISEKMKFKTGISISHENIHMIQRGVVSSWIRDYYSKYLGMGLMTNLQFQKIFNLPLNFDIFLTPAWLKNIHMDREPYYSYNLNEKDLFVMNVQVGLAYVIDLGK